MSQSFQSITCTNGTNYIDCTKGGNNSNYIVIDGDTVRISYSRTISAPSDPGNSGEICYDNNYIYICVSEDTWKRSPLTTWSP
jgi:hypothetical protein